jgi:hypothetical protein
MRADSEPSPVDGDLSGLDLVGSGSASATVRFGSVGAKTEATNTSLVDAPVNALARATFEDVFVWNGGAGKLRFILNLDGIVSSTGTHPGLNVAGVDATLSLSSTISPDEVAFGQLTAPGSMTVTIDMLPFDGVNFTLDLQSFVALTEFGHGSATENHASRERQGMVSFDSHGPFRLETCGFYSLNHYLVYCKRFVGVEVELLRCWNRGERNIHYC